MNLSLCMIVRDESKTLARCLESVCAAVDEIVLLDTGSTDDTPAIARQFTDSFYTAAWTDDFSAARNHCFAKATGDYLLWLDADDVIAPAMLPRLAALRERIERENADMVMCPYVSGGCVFVRERIVRRCAQAVWQGRVHECIPPFGKCLRDRFTVTHLGSDKPRGARNLHLYQKWRAEEPLGARDLFYYGRELYYNRLYEEAEAILSAMLRGDGWYVNKIEACKVLAACREARGDRTGALRALLDSFLYGLPRGAICHAIGRILREVGRHHEAIYWYERALACPDYSVEGDFDNQEERTLLPLLGMVCSHWALGNKQEALLCHTRTMRLAPDHPAVRHNQDFFLTHALPAQNTPAKE